MRNKKIKIIIYAFIFLFLSFVFIYIYHWEFRKPLLEIHFISLNRGRAIFIRTVNNKTILFGAGQNTEIIREINKIMPFYSRKIDSIVIPSAMPAQIGGFLEVLNRYEIDEVIYPDILATSTVLTQLMKEINKNKIHIREVSIGDEILFDNVTFNILFPYKDFKFNKTSLPELAVSISYGSTAVYLFGNLSRTIQKDISKSIKIDDKKNLLEYYNNAGDTKVFKDLQNKLKPEFIFSTKEKTMHFISNGKEWFNKK